MTIQAATLIPGLLVSLKTSVTGNVRYAKVTITPDTETEDGALVARWETERHIADRKEHEEAIKVRGKARNLIIGVCANSAFGLLCPETKIELLDKAVAEARALADEFNSRARLSRINVYVIAGRIAPDDVEAVRALKAEINGLLSNIEDGIRKLDPTKIREAAAKARSVGQMLSPQAQERVQVAIEAARSAARRIIKGGEAAAVEVDLIALEAINNARTAFLDLDEAQDITTPVAVDGRAVDFAPEAHTIHVSAAPAPQIEL